ncbi:hypothetical protein TTHERM_01084240 (macronuclear) [Tetrahymena thermophila SB210]|uniref:C2 domain protein n=1 Tax=Tetrahymena thermophila (strain SB210) TaxID=312017 RepID=Q22BU3_TETTS|nr:hypothetical protein TTHERM_01084240 [Tetrahymena thermophila SB210]EAR82757.2 hypothetical protein TTHERM_01084240 [Tetrahymena thermophila SB210]|eukprot:XP_001030420.2 hypothetical protein TTHERM_01084240 [Tetrahymena thermophila SB210]
MQNQMTSSITNSSLSNGSSNITNQIQSPQVSNQNYFSIRGLNCIFTSSIPCSSNQSCNPYIVMKINGQNIISSVCKVVSNSAFWNDCLSLRVEQDQLEKLITVEIHNYTLYQTERDLFDSSYDEKDYLGGGIIDLTDVISQRVHNKYYNNNSNNSFTILQSNSQTNISSVVDGKSSQLSNITGSIISSGSSSNSSNNNQNSVVYLGQTKIINKEGIVIGSLQFNMHKDNQQNSNNIYSNTTSTQNTQQVVLDENYKSITTKLNEIIPQINKNMQMLQQSISYHNQAKPTEYMNKRDTFYEEKEFLTNKNTIQTPSSSKQIVFNNNMVSQPMNYNLKNNPYLIYTMKSTITEHEDQSYTNTNYQYTQQNVENSQTPRLYSYNTIQLGEEDRINQNYGNSNSIDESNSSNFQEDCDQYDQASNYSQDNEAQQEQIHQIAQNQKNSEQLLLQPNIAMNEYQNTNTVISPLRDIHDKNCISSLSLSQNGKKYVGFQSQFGQAVQYPQIYSQQQHQHIQQNQVGLINLQNISYQQYTGTAPTISTCSQRNNQINQVPYSNFSQAIQVLGQNSMNTLPNQSNQFQFQNNFIRTVQSQKTIVNKIQQATPNLNQYPSPSVIQYQNNGINQIANTTNNTVATPGAIQKVNLGVSTSRQPFSAAATPFKNQRNAQNFYQPF